MAGVNRLLSMQTPRGGFGVWPGESEPVPWGTSYVVHTLIDAQKQGYPVPQERIDPALAYLEQEVTKLENGAAGTHDFKYNMDPQKWEPYAHFALALGGRARKARAEHLIQAFPANPSGEQAEQLYLLKAAVHLAGDHRYERDLKKPDASPLTASRSWDYSFYSDLRRRGLLLNVFADLFGGDKAATPLADLLADEFRKQGSESFSTQELSWGVSGLGKFVGKLSALAPSATLSADGKRLAPELPKGSGGAGDPSWLIGRASELSSLVLEVPKVNGTLYLLLSSEGVRKEAKYVEGGNKLRVDREYKDIEGNPVSLSELKLGQMVFAALRITNTSEEKLTNLALVDRFPAGLEIENPRLGRDVKVEWVDTEKLWAADYMDIRDDRLQVFGSLRPREERQVVYTLRAVTAGSFAVPPLEAGAMYDPRVWAREVGRNAEIKGPWDDYVN
jgi:alpha-2-macroglobulin